MKLIGYLDDNSVQDPKLRLNTENWSIRVAVRSVLFDKQGKVALLYLRNQDIYKIPGGGVKIGEDLGLALEREIAEETGCKAKTLQELGAFVEYKENWKRIQISYCYTSEVEEYGEPSFTKSEIEDGFELLWVDNLEKAIELARSVKPDDIHNKYMSTRDLKILENTKNPKL